MFFSIKERLRKENPLFRTAICFQLLILIPFFLSVAFRLFFPQVAQSGVIRFFLNYKKEFLCLALLFVLFDILYLKRDFLSIHKVEIGAILGITFFSTLLLYMPGVSKGHDLPFHLTRIEGITDAIKGGQFPVRLQPMWFGGYGYPVSIYYGDLLLSFPVLLRLFNVPLGFAYEAYVFVITALTAFVSHMCFKRIFKSTEIGLISSLAYTTSTYRLVDVFTRSAVGEYTAFIFFPVIALAMFRILSGEKTVSLKNCFLFALGMSGLVMTHILSSELTVFALIVTCLILWKRAFTKNALVSFLLAAIMTLLFSASFIVPFLDYYKNVSVVVQNLGPRHIQYAGVYIVQLFTFFQSPQGLHIADITRRMPYTPGIVLMASFILALAFFVYKAKDRQILLYIVLSVIILFFSTNLFPYDAIAETKIGNLIAQMQVPFRWIAVATVFLTLLLGRLLVLSCDEFPKAKYAVFVGIIVISVFQTTYYASSFLPRSLNHFVKDKAEFGTIPTHENEYVLFGSDVSKLGGEICESGVKVTDVERNRNSFSLTVQSLGGSDGAGGYVELPVFNYKGYRAVLSDGQRLQVSDGDNRVVRVHIPPSFSGTVKVSFVPPALWRVAEIISVVSLIAAFALFFVRRKTLCPIAE